MNRLKFLSANLLVALIMLNSCSDSDDEPNPCLNGPEISVDEVLASVEGKSTGEITVSAAGGASPYMFSIDGTTFQSSGTFSGLEAGNIR